MQGWIKELMARGSEHFYYVGATILSAGVHFMYSVFVKTRIEPLEYGIYSTCLMLQTYMAYVQLGSLNAFNRDYPQLVGSGDTVKASNYRNSTFTFLILAFGISTIIISAFILCISEGRDTRFTYGFIFCAIITTVTVLENFLASRVRIDGDFKYTSFVIVAELISFIIGFGLISKIGYYGLYIVTIGAYCIGIFLYYKKGLYDLQFVVDIPLIKVIILSGLPLLINNLIWTVVNSIDKFIIIGFINMEALGFYSIAQMAFSYMVLVPNAMSQLFYVKLGKIYGATNSVDNLNKTAMRYTLIISIVVSFIVLSAYFYLEPLISWIMPKYSDGIKSAQILLLGLAIYAPTVVNGNILTILKKNAALLRGSIYLCILNAICSMGLVILCGATIENVALGTSISYFVRTVILVYQLKYNAGTDVMKMMTVSVFPVLITAGTGIIIYHIVCDKLIGFVIACLIAFVVAWVMYTKEFKYALR